MIALRPITPDDREFLLAVYASTRLEELAVTDWSDEQKRVFLAAQFAAQHEYYSTYYDGATFMVILLDGERTGRLYVQRTPEVIRLMDIALIAEFRGRGIGSTLVRELLAEGEAKGIPVVIHVEMNNPALRLYERLGFRPVGTHGIYVRMEWSPVRQLNTAS